MQDEVCSTSSLLPSLAYSVDLQAALGVVAPHSDDVVAHQIPRDAIGPLSPRLRPNFLYLSIYLSFYLSFFLSVYLSSLLSFPFACVCMCPRCLAFTMVRPSKPETDSNKRSDFCSHSPMHDV